MADENNTSVDAFPVCETLEQTIENTAVEAQNTGLAGEIAAVTEQSGEKTNDERNTAEDDAEVLLQDGGLDISEGYDVGALQRQCTDYVDIINYIQNGVLPQNDDARARKIILQAERYVWLEDRLWHLQLPRNRRQKKTESVTRQLDVPKCLRQLILSKIIIRKNLMLGRRKCTLR